MWRYTIVDRNGSHFGYGRTEDLATVLGDVERLNTDPAVMCAIATGDPAFYAAPFRAVTVLNERGRVAEITTT